MIKNSLEMFFDMIHMWMFLNTSVESTYLHLFRKSFKTDAKEPTNKTLPVILKYVICIELYLSSN